MLQWMPRPGWSKIKKKPGTSPAIQAGDAPAVAFLGPERRRPPMFYFHSKLPADVDVDALPTDSSISSAHPPSFSVCMAWLRVPSTVDGAVVGTGGAVRRNVIHARAAVLPFVPA